MTDFLGREEERLTPTDTPVTDTEFLEKEILSWRSGRKRHEQIKGCLYYQNRHDIIHRQRTVIGRDGQTERVDNLPNNRIVLNLYGKLVDQKTDYLLGKPFLAQCENKVLEKELKEIFGQEFRRVLKNAGRAALNCGIAWLYPHIGEKGLTFKLFQGHQILPFWRDSDHTQLDMAVRIYRICRYRGKEPVTEERAEVFTAKGIRRYTLDGGRLIPEGGRVVPYLNADCGGRRAFFNWREIPLIPVKYNEEEIPLLNRVKSLQDSLNDVLSDFKNNMQEDPRNTILVLKNYDGTDLGEFRRNLAQYGAVKVRCEGEAQGGVETLSVEVDGENYQRMIRMLKKAIMESGMGLDLSEVTSGSGWNGNSNQMLIRSMYTDLDLDADNMEGELQAAFSRLLPFVCAYLYGAGRGGFFGERVNIIFNRDMPVNESEVID
ncbi:MAG: phage portal protein, partial [[Eubacterium] siraeum]|nr:phage portal protein [[Eubacterium] siraeum]